MLACRPISVWTLSNKTRLKHIDMTVRPSAPATTRVTRLLIRGSSPGPSSRDGGRGKREGESPPSRVMGFPGAIPPPPGVVPDLENPDNFLRKLNYITQAMTIVIVSGFVAMRYYSKRTILRGVPTLDDYATYVAYVLMIGFCIISCLLSVHGGGLNQWEVLPSQIEPFVKARPHNRLLVDMRQTINCILQVSYVGGIIYPVMALSVKLALLTLIVRIFGSVYHKVFIGVKIFLGILVVYYIADLCVKIFICWPIASYWDGGTGKCLHLDAILTANSIMSVISYFVILLLPIPLTWSMQLPKPKRLRIIGLLCAGGVAAAFSVYRLILALKNLTSKNVTMILIRGGLAANAEIGIGLICACLPAISALIVHRQRGCSCDRQPSHSTPEGPGGEITVTRCFVVDSAHEEPGLVAGVVAQASQHTIQAGLEPRAGN
ncbi:hypothetical protein TOPH_08107 [Tolypocladium ophioglossoides CBS 100239]|uniref:Rhodopsin domain-containing protein n=1 Tax=Tolypocladium ophioglossoides (strain CBS 100239) TaxID=1163406 RepID=A0A0L0MZM6_TOLOC|nr:hypothetical protein TOPH_08107 [Tolypocladium ophioglossoides CBS 100239]